MQTRLTFASCLFLAALFCDPGWAQQSAGGTGGGGTGSGGTAGNAFGVSSFTTPSSTGFNSGMTSGQSSGSGTTGATGGTGGFGTTVISRPGFLAPSGIKGFLTPSNTSAISSTATRSTSTGGIGGINSRLGGLSGMGGFGNQMGRTNSTNTSSTSQLRIPMRIAGNSGLTGPVRSAVATRFSERVTKLPGFQTSDVKMTAVEGRTAVLQGKVASKEQAELLGRLALLEPGISAVRNELAVDPELVGLETLPSGR